MRWTHALIPTLREAPQDAEIASHQLLLRGGLIRKLSGGIYTFLPLGLRALRKVERIVREEMDRVGALEVLLPAMQPRELWERGPRFDAAKRVMFAAQPLSRERRAVGDLVLGPTHEEVITSTIADEVRSWRQLPKNFYQIQTKFRDELRPRFGLLRAKEFLMKDAYSFDANDSAAEASYRKMYDAYREIFDRCGLKYRIVEADTGVMGGSFSHEFAVPCAVGESEIAFTEDGSYAASIEKARSRFAPRDGRAPRLDTPEKFATPGALTIEALTKNHGVAAADQIKTLVYLCDAKLVLFLLRGDHALNEAKVVALGISEFRAATEAEIAGALGARAGSLGAVGIRAGGGISSVIADEALRDQEGMTTGANEDGFHLRGVSVARDLAVTRWADLRTAVSGELDAASGKPIKIERAIEVGHVFKLGVKYSEAFKANYLDAHGKEHPCVMGCYGIGVTRTLQAIVEQHHDKDGIVWPAAVAPYHALIQLLEAKNAEATACAEKLEETLAARGIEVLFDDRDERPGIKFKDGDLIGIPFQIRIGKKFLQNGKLEFRARGGGATEDLDLVDVPDRLAALLRSTGAR
ncbi:MAG: proline--tRNA ligase [Verrucomicrobiae bacterium]|nr:proline--tRNA ligase [Verrucomicrobiae bacterium]